MVTCGDRPSPSEGTSTKARMCPRAWHRRGLEEATDGGVADRGAERGGKGVRNRLWRAFHCRSLNEMQNHSRI